MKIWPLFLMVSVISPCLGRKIKLDKIEAEIKALKFDEVQVLLKKLYAIKDLTADEEKQVYADLHDTAADVADDYRDNKSIIKSWKDAAMSVIGAAGVVLGIATAIIGPYRFNDSQSRLACQSGGGFSALLGCYLFYKGVTCSTQKAWAEQAQEIQKYFDIKYNKMDLSQKQVSPDLPL